MLWYFYERVATLLCINKWEQIQQCLRSNG